MTGINKHIIRKQVIDLQYYGRNDGFMLQRQVNGWCYEELAAAIEQQFSRLPDDGRVYSIDRLEIEVDVDASGNWLTKATEQVAQQLHHRLSEEMHKAASAASGHQPKKYAEHFLEVMIFFLQHGYMPWWSPVTTKAAWQEALEDLLQQGLTQQARERLLAVMQQENVQQRIVYQLPVPLFVKLVLQLRPGIEQELITMTGDIGQWLQQSSTGEKNAVMALFRKSVLTAIQEQDTERCLESISYAFLQQLTEPKMIQRLQASARYMRSERLKKAIEEKQFRQQLHEPSAKEEQEVKKGKDNNKEVHKAADRELAEGIYISNAGLVIVAAFLPAFFSKLQLLQGNALADPDRAVALVQYMASGKEQVAEFELGLAGILCGLEPDTPVDTDIELSAAEKQEINDLLSSVIEYWSILQDTSIEGLQETFLQREGRLRFVNNEWLLTVEQKGYDVLLQNLPWSISMIKLPWMQWILKTEWM